MQLYEKLLFPLHKPNRSLSTGKLKFGTKFDQEIIPDDANTR